MNRTQIHIKDAVGQIMGQPIVSRTEQEVLIPVGNDKFAIIGAVAVDDQGYLETTVTRVPFDYRYYEFEELAKAFNPRQLQDMKVKYLREMALREAEQKRIRHERYLALKAEFEPQAGNESND